MIRFFAGHPTAANLLMGLLLISGVMALPALKRETFPDFTSDAVRVNVVYPGATAETVEEALWQRIDVAVECLTNLD